MAELDIHGKDTIAALLTGSSDGVVSIVRISGPAATRVRERCFRKTRPGPFRVGTLHVGEVVDAAGAGLMEGMCVSFADGASYTGENAVEIHGMGGRINAQRLLDTVLAAGARQAQPGEFTLRAYLRGRVGLDQAEAVAAMLGAQSHAAAQQAQRLRGGALGAALEPLRESMLALLAETEAYLDFPEDGLPEQRRAAHRALALQMAADLLQMVKGSHRTRRMLEGARVVLWGAPNAGKSTLFNALCGEDRAIVDEAPGTTRDVVETRVLWAGMPVTLVDTAGVRQGTNRVEQEGVQRSRTQCAGADAVLWCISTDSPASAVVPPPATAPVLVVETKGDLASDFGTAPGAARRLNTDVLPVSALLGEGVAELTTRLLQLLGADGPGEANAVVATARQGALLTRAAECLQHAVAVRDGAEPEEVAAQCLRDAAEALGDVCGRVLPTEEVLGAIFGRFCIGK